MGNGHPDPYHGAVPGIDHPAVPHYPGTTPPTTVPTLVYPACRQWLTVVHQASFGYSPECNIPFSVFSRNPGNTTISVFSRNPGNTTVFISFYRSGFARKTRVLVGFGTVLPKRTPLFGKTVLNLIHFVLFSMSPLARGALRLRNTDNLWPKGDILAINIYISGQNAHLIPGAFVKTDKTD